MAVIGASQKALRLQRLACIHAASRGLIECVA